MTDNQIEEYLNLYERKEYKRSPSLRSFRKKRGHNDCKWESFDERQKAYGT